MGTEKNPFNLRMLACMSGKVVEFIDSWRMRKIGFENNIMS